MNTKVRMSAVLVLMVLETTMLSLPAHGKTEGTLYPPGSNVGQPEDKIRNVILISIDTCRADHLGCYGYPRRTAPNIDSLAEEAILFNHAVTPVPLTLPAHSSMLTGMAPLYHKVHDNTNYCLANSNLTLAEILKDKGFITAAFVGAFVLDSQFGLDQGFDIYNDQFEKPTRLSLVFFVERSAEEVTTTANRWLQENHHQKFFLFLHYFDAHVPYMKHRRFALPFSKQLYDGEITYIDHHIGRVFEKLKELNLYDQTLIIVTADHGEGLKQHSEKTHGFFIYNTTLHVPLIIKVPGGPKGIKIGGTVGLIDILPTVCGSLGIPCPNNIQGKDLSPCFSSQDNLLGKRYFFCESLLPTKFDLGPLFGLVNGHFKYIHSSEPELYNLDKDPRETENLANKNAVQTRIMQDQLKSVLRDKGFQSIVGSKVTMDSQTRGRLQSLGYVSDTDVEEHFQFEQQKPTAKDFIEVHNAYEDILTYSAAGKYRKAKKICQEILEKRPELKYVHLLRGNIALYEQDARGIITHFSKYLEYRDPNLYSPDALHVRPHYAHVYLNLGAALGHEGKLQQALENYKKALIYNPHMSSATYNIAGVYIRTGRQQDAKKYLEKTLVLDPNMAKANLALGNIFLQEGHFDKALTNFNRALELEPGSQKALDALRKTQEQISRAIALWNESLQENPNQPDLHAKLGLTHQSLGNLKTAVYHWEKALQLQPDLPEALNNLAWIKANSEGQDFYNPPQALQLAQRACELTGYGNAAMLDTLAEAYAADGRKSEAIRFAQDALTLAQLAGQEKLAAEIQNRLKLYKHNQQ